MDNLHELATAWTCQDKNSQSAGGAIPSAVLSGMGQACPAVIGLLLSSFPVTHKVAGRPILDSHYTHQCDRLCFVRFLKPFKRNAARVECDTGEVMSKARTWACD